MIERAHAALVLSMLIGCGGSADVGAKIVHDPCTEIVIESAEDTTESQLSSIAVATEWWNAFGRTQLALSPAIEGSPVVPVIFRDAAANFFGTYESDKGNVLINRRLLDDHARAVTIAHELGHMMGLGHVDRAERLSVMNPANLEIPPTAEDEGALIELWASSCTPPR